MPYPYIEQSDLESRVSAAKLRRLLDDDDTGAASADAVTRVIADASAKVAGVLRATYPLADVEANTPEEVKRLTLDCAVAYLAQRHPEAVNLDWVPLMEQVDRDLKMLRRAETRLDIVSTPEPPANVGGDVDPGYPQNVAPCKKPFFSGGMGDW